MQPRRGRPARLSLERAHEVGVVGRQAVDRAPVARLTYGRRGGGGGGTTVVPAGTHTQ